MWRLEIIAKYRRSQVSIAKGACGADPGMLVRRICALHTSPNTGVRLFDSCRGIDVKTGRTKGS